MEGYVDSLEGDGGEAPFQVYRGRFGQGEGLGFADYGAEFFLHGAEGEGGQEGGYVDFLGFEEVCYVG